MVSSQKGIISCPRCGRTVRTYGTTYSLHSTEAHNEQQCRMSRRRIPITGMTAADFEARAWLVASLACEVQDADPAEVWDYLTALPADEVQRLLVIALAGLPTDKTVDQIWAWVNALPVARGATA